MNWVKRRSAAGLRWGELAALRRYDIDLEAGAVRITRQLNEVSGRLAFGPPKSAAGRRVVHFPAVITPELRWHLGARFAQPGDDGPVFTSPAGGRFAIRSSGPARGCPPW